MKVIQLPFCFYPDPVGGTEVYVEALSRHLQKQGVEVLIAAPGEVNQEYLHNQLPVKRFALSNTVTDLREIYGKGDDLAALEFSRILDREQPDLVHLHAFTRGVSLRLVQVVKSKQIPVIFTYHTPTVSCQRGTLMQWGTQVCNGKLDLHTCARCTLQGLGLGSIGANLIGSFPPIIGSTLGTLDLQGGAWTALRMTELVGYRHAAFYTLMKEVNYIVAVCDWIKDVLIYNQVPPQKIAVIRQGLCHPLPEKNILKKQQNNDANSILKIAFLGRLDPIKGVHIVIKALQLAPELPINFDIYGVSQGAAGDTYHKELLALANNDSRIIFKSPLHPDNVVATLASYDLLAVPSQWLETGPMVVLEAFAAGIPVIGSNLGGIEELVKHEVNGILVEPNSVEAWYQELQRLCWDKEFLRQLRTGILEPRNMRTVAEEMLQLYGRILKENIVSQEGIAVNLNKN